VTEPGGWQRTIRTDVPVLVFKLTRDRLQHGSLAVARSLGRLGVRVYFATPDRRTPALVSRYSAGQPIVLEPVRGDCSERLLEVADRLGDHPVLVAGDDVAALFVDEHLETLQARFRLPNQPRGLPRRLSDKAQLHALCAETGVPSPEARFPRTRNELLRNAGELGFPVVIKSMDPVVLRRRPGSMSVAVARTPEQALAIYDSGEDPRAPNLMLQEYIPGDARSIWMFNGYLDAAGECPIGFVGQKIRQSPPRTGATSLGVARANEGARALAIDFLSRIGYRGIVDLGFRFDARDGRYKLLDVNPRIGSSFRLFVGRNGVDVVRAMYLDITGQMVPATTIRPGRRWLVEDQDAATAWRLWREGQLGVRGYVASLRGLEETAWLSVDDPRPVTDLMRVSLGRLAAIGRSRFDRALRQLDGGSATPPS
jgi:D-aspartate ligase